MKTQTKFIKNVAILSTGTALAQGLTIIVAPVLSRLYDPSDFGIFSLYTSIIMILSVIIAWRYELAIVLARDDYEARNIFLISIILTIINSGFISLIILLLKDQIVLLLDIPAFSKWIWWIPVSICAMGIYESLNYWSTRRKSFKRLSVSIIFRSAGMTSVQLGGGVAKVGAFGLIGGQILGQVLGSTILAYQVLKDDKKIIKSSVKIKDLITTAKEFKEFPFFSTPQGFLSALSRNISPFFLVFYYGTSIAGLYALALKLLQVPLNLIGNSIFQVFYPQITEEFNQTGDIYFSYKKIVFSLLALGIIPTTVIFIFGPELFSFLLGENWFEAGVYASWLIVWLYFSFVAKPAIAVIRILKWQRYHLIGEVILLTVTLLVLYLGGKYATPTTTIVYYSLVGMLYQVSLIVIVFIKTKMINKKVKETNLA